MKVYIGPYKKWWGPYQIAELLKYIGVGKDRCYEIGNWLSTTWVNEACVWIDSKRKRTIKVKVHPYDTWNADSTLAHIIVPLLKEFRSNITGVPTAINQEDVPVELRTDLRDQNNIVPLEHSSKQWEWILDEIIWAFENMDESDWNLNNVDIYNQSSVRRQKGLELFGKYLIHIWN
jgi:hypothetical protein